MSFFLIALVTIVFIFACVAGMFGCVYLKKRKRHLQKKQHYQNIIGQVVEISWGKECYCIGAGGAGWRVDEIDGQWVGPIDNTNMPLLGKKVRLLDITGEYTVSVELLPDEKKHSTC